MKIAIASDHGAYALKQQIVNYLSENKEIEVLDLGTNDEKTSVDYPDFAKKAALAIQNKIVDCAIIMCGTGIGISIAANKFKGIRAALCHDAYTAQMAKQHNNANILAFGGRTTGIEIAKQMIDIWLNTKYEAGRHQLRLDKMIDNI
jgi:ribose 5-phosphate isomerase B